MYFSNFSQISPTCSYHWVLKSGRQSLIRNILSISFLEQIELLKLVLIILTPLSLIIILHWLKLVLKLITKKVHYYLFLLKSLVTEKGLILALEFCFFSLELVGAKLIMLLIIQNISSLFLWLMGLGTSLLVMSWSAQL